MAAVCVLKNDVASSLMMKSKTEFFKYFDRFPARDDRQDSHQAATLISTISGEGIGRFWLFRSSIIPSIASRMFLRASSRFFPWEIHPGRERHSPTIYPSAPGVSGTKS